MGLFFGVRQGWSSVTVLPVISPSSNVSTEADFAYGAGCALNSHSVVRGTGRSTFNVSCSILTPRLLGHCTRSLYLYALFVKENVAMILNLWVTTVAQS